MGQVCASPHLLHSPLLPAVHTTDCILISALPQASPSLVDCTWSKPSTPRHYLIPEYLRYVCSSFLACLSIAFALLICLRPFSYFLCTPGTFATSPFAVKSPFLPSPSCASALPEEAQLHSVFCCLDGIHCFHSPCSFRPVSILRANHPPF